MYIQALLKELKESAYARLGQQERIKTLYFGGGTPSVLEQMHIEMILDTVRDNYILEDDIELTLEANPDDLDPSYLAMLRERGFNRLSIGIQSFRAGDLELMRRSHTVDQALDCLKEASRAGFQNINIDLIYGIPGLSAEDWASNLETAMQQPVQHISAYHLTFEEGTVFSHMLKKGKLNEIPEELSIKQYEILKEAAARNGFEHYEISNFARQGYRSMHNSSYWQGRNYYGFGPAAHSYNGLERKWNVSNLMKYVDGINRGEGYFDIETLSEADRFNEYLIISLRTCEGINLKQISSLFDMKYREILEERMGEYILSGDLLLDGERIYMTAAGWLRSDGIIENLMV